MEWMMDLLWWHRACGPTGLQKTGSFSRLQKSDSFACLGQHLPPDAHVWWIEMYVLAQSPKGGLGGLDVDTHGHPIYLGACAIWTWWGRSCHRSKPYSATVDDALAWRL